MAKSHKQRQNDYQEQLKSQDPEKYLIMIESGKEKNCSESIFDKV